MQQRSRARLKPQTLCSCGNKDTLCFKLVWNVTWTFVHYYNNISPSKEKKKERKTSKWNLRFDLKFDLRYIILFSNYFTRLLGYSFILQRHSLAIKNIQSALKAWLTNILCMHQPMPVKLKPRKLVAVSVNLKLTNVSPASPSKVRLTIITSMGIGTGSLALYLSFSSLAMNTTTMITMDITRSQMLVEVIWTKIFSRVCAKEPNTVYSTPEILGKIKSVDNYARH